jgi:hypothetical protein
MDESMHDGDEQIRKEVSVRHAPQNLLSAGAPPPGANGRAPKASAPPATEVQNALLLLYHQLHQLQPPTGSGVDWRNTSDELPDEQR